ncbi:histone-lysine N-methyltransferase SUVR4-like [Zingiber officinale]|uniref:histone-lysine N-methyltransferase SUVR4-like n=1 Tax=Zingiber officinale TaxID=94328 RepID=UPI001C4BE7AC|nr:histone-lysine N-methyltransferase SUVR4-like [Zingiber officinale]
MRNTNFSSNPIREMDRPFDSDSPVFETPIAMIPPSNPILSSEGMTLDGRKSWKEKSSLEAHQRNPESLSIDDRSSCTVDIASSELGEVKLSFSCSSMQPDFRMPSLESVLKCVEDRCLNSYRILHPDFSLMNLMKEMCSCFMELGTKTTDDKHENPIQTVPAVDSSKNNSASAVPSDSSVILMSDPSSTKSGGSSQVRRVQKLKEPQLPVCARDTSLSLMMVQSQNSFSVATVRYNAADISKGEEKVRISVINEISDEIYPPHFNYLPRNIVYQNAYVNVSLARIGDEDCCPDCYDDCLAAPLPCACARETGGEFAYTSDGLIRREILDEYISMLNEPNKHHHYYCKECPIERIKNAISPEPCKGHLMRKFVKECWSKCGCSMHCGNRLVQRGITCNLQVFLTSKEKGWGVRTLDKLPRGAFVCEYVGEILTNMELYDRTIMTTGNARHTYPVLLDADWGSEGVLKDEEALCLDATFYGNVARFINHRCFDANLIGIPVEIETPDHHYYHLAFFTRRKIEAYEELTWDYCIDFDDDSHPVKAFRCRCGSRFCRDTRSHRSSIISLILSIISYISNTGSSSFLYHDVVVYPDNVVDDDNIIVPNLLDVVGAIDNDGSVRICVVETKSQESLPLITLPSEPIKHVVALSDDGSVGMTQESLPLIVRLLELDPLLV